MKNTIIIIFTVIALAGAFLVGCSKMKDNYPADFSPTLAKYIGIDGMKKAGINVDANGVVDEWWINKGQLRRALQIAHEQHSLTQAEIHYWAQKDNISWGDANSIGTTDYLIAEKEAATTAQLFWTGVGLAFTGGFGAIATKFMVGNSMWSEAEHSADVQAKVEEAKTRLLTTHWTNPEVAVQTATTVRNVCLVLGCTDAAKIEEIVKNEVAKAVAEV